MRHESTLKYSGLTIVLSQPSRFDTHALLSGYSGQAVEHALNPLPRQACHLQTADEGVAPPHGTTVVLLCGTRAMDKYFPLPNADLFEYRGAPFCDTTTGIIYVPTFSPQDAFDLRDYEGQYNPALQGSDDGGVDEDSGDDSDMGAKAHGKTRRGNWRFWLLADVRKAVRLTLHGLAPHGYPTTHIYPPLDSAINALTQPKGSSFCFDIETDYSHNITVLSFAFTGGPTWTIPIRRYTGELAYDNLGRLFRALAIGLRDNEVVIHNSLFDLFVLARRLRIPFGRRVYDTMLAHHRLYPEVEKSLGHCLSLYTDLPYHKNEGVFEPHNAAQEEALWHYNAKDVFVLTGLKAALDIRAKELGAVESIQQVNRSIIPYLTMMLHGIRYDQSLRDNIISDNRRRATQVRRLLRILTGVDLNPNSPKQVSAFLYDKAGGLAIKKPAKDLTNEKTLFKILTKQQVPPISLILEYRRLIKEASLLDFTPFKL